MLPCNVACHYRAVNTFNNCLHWYFLATVQNHPVAHWKCIWPCCRQEAFTRNTQAWVKLSTSHVATSYKGWSSLFSGVFKKSLLIISRHWVLEWFDILSGGSKGSIYREEQSSPRMTKGKSAYVCLLFLHCPCTKWYSFLHLAVIVTIVLKEKSRRNIQILQNWSIIPLFLGQGCV